MVIPIALFKLLRLHFMRFIGNPLYSQSSYHMKDDLPGVIEGVVVVGQQFRFD